MSKEGIRLLFENGKEAPFFITKDNNIQVMRCNCMSDENMWINDREHNECIGQPVCTRCGYFPWVKSYDK